MSYEKYYPNGWQSGETGGTPITPEALNHMEEGIKNSAPAGYGLGEQVYSTNRFYTMAELDNLKKTCDFAIATSASITIGHITFSQAYGRHTAYNDGGHHQELFMLGMGCVLERDCWNGVWSPWDCRNPPMDLGVEYRTTERWQGRAVYCRMINIGALPNSTMKNTPIDFGVTHMVRYEGVTNAGDAIPYVYSTNRIELACEPTYVRVTTTADYSYLQAYITLYYTKD